VELAAEGIRLTRVALGQIPDRPMLSALLALMLLQHSRRDARVRPDGSLVLLPDQERSRWHHDEIEEALSLLTLVLDDEAADRDAHTRELTLQAMVAAEHATAVTAADTRWDRIARLYAELEQLTGSAVVRLNRAVAVAEDQGAVAGLALLDGLDERLPVSHRLPATRAALLERVGRVAAAAAAYDLAAERCGNEAERRHLLAARDALSAG
jgi:RNA polymerase sigma-70 factor (ECF subfamily)